MGRPARPPARPLVRSVALGARTHVRIWRHDGSFPVASDGAHPEIEVAWIAEGQVRYRVGSAEVCAGPGEVVVVPAQAQHHTTFDTALHGVALALDPALVAEVAETVRPGRG